MGLGKSWILGAGVVPLRDLTAAPGVRCESSAADQPGTPWGTPALCRRACGRAPGRGSLWGWGAFLLKAGAQKQGTKPSLSHHQASPPRALGWAARGPSTTFNQNWLLYAGKLSAQLEYLSLSEPSITSHPARVPAIQTELLACSFQWGNGHSLSRPEQKARWELHCVGRLGLAEEGTSRMDPSSEQKPEYGESEISRVTEARLWGEWATVCATATGER